MSHEYLRSLVLSCLYTPGKQACRSLVFTRWPQVSKAVRCCTAIHEVPEALRSKGLVSEALILETPDNLLAAQQLLSQRSVLTAECCSYPSRWIQLLEAAAPPVFWIRGQMPAGSPVSVLADGDSAVEAEFAAKCRAIAVRQQCVVVSGASVIGRSDNDLCSSCIGKCVAILPCGMAATRTTLGSCLLSFSGQDDAQTFASRTRRNELLAVLSNHVIVAHARFKEGDSWHTAVAALRSRKARVLVRRDDNSPAHRALIALGGLPVSSTNDVAAALRQIGPGTVDSEPDCSRSLTAA